MDLFSGYCYSSTTKSRLANFLYNSIYKKPVILCIGSDKMLADCLAPLTAELLRKKDFSYFVYGGLSAPITTKNAEFACDFIHTIHKNSQIIVIDSMATTRQSRLGTIIISDTYKSAINNLNLDANLYIYGITSLLDSTNNLLTNARLNNIEKIATTITNALCDIANFYTEISKLKEKQLPN